MWLNQVISHTQDAMAFVFSVCAMISCSENVWRILRCWIMVYFSECSVNIVTRSILIKFSYLFFRNHGLGSNCSLSRAHHSQALQHMWPSREDYAMSHRNKSDKVDGLSVVHLPSVKKQPSRESFQKTYGICHNHNSLSNWIPRSWFLFFPVGRNTWQTNLPRSNNWQ